MKAFDLPAAEAKIKELHKVTEKPDFWTSDDAQDVSKQLARLEAYVNRFNDCRRATEDLEALAELIGESEDKELVDEFYASAGELNKQIEEYKTVTLLNEEYDPGDAIMMIHSGAGGLEAQDWAEMLYRMYTRWAERKSYALQVIDELPDQEAGLKSVTFKVSGDYAYGYLKGEQGVHRLVRISPFDAARRRHTSFASVEVLPILPDSVEVEIRPEDLKMDTFRASGAGGQYVNRTDSAVRITHIPTGIVVSCQIERSQHMNRETAMQVLRSKLFEKARRERQEQLDNIQGEKRAIAWGSQIRSYTLQPFQLIKDHRSGCEVGNVQAALDGDIDELIMSYLRFCKTGRMQTGGSDK